MTSNDTQKVRRGVFLLSTMTFIAGMSCYWFALRHDSEINWTDALTLPAFTILFAWLSFSFAMATAGFVVSLKSRRRAAGSQSSDQSEAIDGSRRTAVLMPVYNESPSSVFAGLRAMFDSLQATGQSDRFDFFVLSDTNRHDVWLQEESHWEALTVELRRDYPDAECHVYYRHRSQNTARKSGNISEFCCKWGDYYDHMIVLDADSLVEGETMVEMVRRMEADSRIGILQVPPVPIGRSSLFARLQQFAADVYGPMFCRGFSAWAGRDANYFGHNAILRMNAFMQHCELPRLGGVPPFGGEILSHDFVEAALMLKADYHVIVACDLAGSYEECPTTIADFAQRDQRWCQGNLQHTRLITASGFHPFSRLHFATGVMSYCASPIWMLFMLTSLIAAMNSGSVSGQGSNVPAVALFTATMVMLFAPKIQSVISLLPDTEAIRRRGGIVRLLLGATFEALASTLLAPILAIYHTRFVLAALRGRTVQWNAQQRDEVGVTWQTAIKSHVGITVFGIAAAGFLAAFVPTMLLWLSPFLAGLILAIPLAVAMGSSSVGTLMGRAGLLRTQAEEQPPEIQIWRDHWASAFANRSTDSTASVLFENLLNDDEGLQRHIEMLQASETQQSLNDEQRAKVAATATLTDVAELDDKLRFAILTDPESLSTLARTVRNQTTTPQRDVSL